MPELITILPDSLNLSKKETVIFSKKIAKAVMEALQEVNEERRIITGVLDICNTPTCVTLKRIRTVEKFLKHLEECSNRPLL